jgi:hypothetical protein
MRAAGVTLKLNTGVDAVERRGEGFEARLSDGSVVRAASLVVATGGKSIPKMGATGWAYELARQFGLRVTETRPALVPLTFETGLLEQLLPLAGVAVEAVVSAEAEGRARLRRGHAVHPPGAQRSGHPADQFVLARGGGDPDGHGAGRVRCSRPAEGGEGGQRQTGGRTPRWAISSRAGWRIRSCSAKACRRRAGRASWPSWAMRSFALGAAVNGWTVKPVGSEGYRTAEVTLGGIDTAALDQQTMAATAVPGLFFIGEAVDITGWLGGYNFQWAWSSSGWEACVRLIPGVLGQAESLSSESFEDGLLEHPQYTRPRTFEGQEIPEVLVSGDHKKVAQWRQEQREITTRERRPDLWAAHTAKD